MALLSNGLETIELGSTAWRDVINNNIYQVYTKDEIKNPDYDLQFTSGTQGPVLKDRTTGTRYRLFVDNGVLDIETA